jgi:2'-5' RNA ligase
LRFVIIHALTPGFAPGLETARAQAHQLTGSAQALRYPPHVTLRTGLVCPDELAESVAQEFLGHAAKSRPARAWTAGWRNELYAPDHGLVALEVRSDGSLETLHRQLLEFKAWAKGPQSSFRPHLTVAFDDLDRTGMQSLAEHFGRPENKLADFSFTVDSVALYYERPEGWMMFGSVPLI